MVRKRHGKKPRMITATAISQEWPHPPPAKSLRVNADEHQSFCAQHE